MNTATLVENKTGRRMFLAGTRESILKTASRVSALIGDVLTIQWECEGDLVIAATPYKIGGDS